MGSTRLDEDAEFIKGLHQLVVLIIDTAVTCPYCQGHKCTHAAEMLLQGFLAAYRRGILDEREESQKER